MSFNVGHIAGGTRSRCRTVKQAHKLWYCKCDFREGPHTIEGNPGWRSVCDTCGDKRPT